MNQPNRNSLPLTLTGITFVAIGFAVFAVRLHHEGGYAMPHGGPLLGGLGAMLLGGIVIWPRSRVVTWLAVAVSPLALFPAIYSIVGELEEVVSLYVTDSEGRTADLRLWIVDRDDGEWVGMSRDKATKHSLNGAQLDMLRGGELRCVMPVLHEDESTTHGIHAMKVEKYAAARGAAMIGLYPREATDTTVVLRLDPC